MPEALDLSSSAFKRDPRPTLGRLCAEGPLRRARLPLVGEVWLATTHEAVLGVLKDAERFAVDARNAGRWGASSRPSRTGCAATAGPICWPISRGRCPWP